MNTILKVSLFGACLLGLVTGCASLNPAHVAQDYNFIDHPQDGVIAYSTRWKFRCDGAVLGQHSYFNIKNETEEHRVILHNPFHGSDFTNPSGNININTVKSGTYTIDAFDINDGHAKYYLRLKRPITIDVERGKVNYIGQLSVDVSSCGVKYVGDYKLNDATVTISITDKWSRDKKMLNEDYKSVLNAATVVKLMRQ